jgi:transposase
MPLPPAPKLVLTHAARKQLETIRQGRTTPRGIVLRANIVLGAADGIANHVLARNLSTSLPTVLLWRRRYENEGLAGVLEDHPRSGRPKQISADKETGIVEATIKTHPKDASHWSVRTMAASQQVSPATVQRIWKKHKLQPHRVEFFKFSTDPEFAPKVRDIVGLYLNPPDRAIVLSVDEKSQIQALDRTQPILGLRPGLPARQTHDYERHGTTTLFAALNVLEGTVIADCQPRHRHQEFLRFLDRIDASVAVGLEVHLILDNYGTHKHPEVKNWLAERPRYHVHFTPTSSSWLNQIERWFAEITRKRIRRGTFRSVRDLIKTIKDYVRHYNRNPQPFQWVTSASKIIRKVNKYKETLETRRLGARNSRHKKRAPAQGMQQNCVLSVASTEAQPAEQAVVWAAAMCQISERLL